MIAIDVGGTAIKGARYGRDGVLDEVCRATPADGAAALAAVCSLAADLRGPRSVAVGVVVPGLVDAAAGIVRYAANLGWRDVGLRDAVAEAVDLPVAIGHDVTAAAQAEFGALHEPDMLFVAVGTGIAAVHVIDGIAGRGAFGHAGELGHIAIRSDTDDVCACGGRGCLEIYASAAGIAHRYAASGGIAGLNARTIVERRTDDAIADRVWSDATDALGRALATATALLDPGVIVLGGGLGAAGPALVEPVRATLASSLSWRSAPPVRVSMLGADAGRIGAAALAWHAAPADSKIGCTP